MHTGYCNAGPCLQSFLAATWRPLKLYGSVCGVPFEFCHIRRSDFISASYQYVYFISGTCPILFDEGSSQADCWTKYYSSSDNPKTHHVENKKEAINIARADIKEIPWHRFKVLSSINIGFNEGWIWEFQAWYILLQITLTISGHASVVFLSPQLCAVRIPQHGTFYVNHVCKQISSSWELKYFQRIPKEPSNSCQTSYKR